MRLLTNVGGSRPTGSLVYDEDIVGTRRVRFLLTHAGKLHALMFMSVSTDGSVICGPAYRRKRIVRTARRRASPVPLPAKLRASLGESATPPDVHVSFHRSGVITSFPDVFTYRAPLAATTVQQLGVLRFEHPNRLPSTNARKRDIVLPRDMRLDKAIELKLTLVPTDTAVFYDGATEQIAILLNCLARGRTTTRYLQLSMLATEKAWPEETTLEWVSQDPNTHGFPE